MSLGYNSNRPMRSSGMNNLNFAVSSIKSKKSSSSSNSTVPTLASTSTSSVVPKPIPNITKTMSIQDNAITQRRLEYVETQLKKTQVEFKEHATKFQDYKSGASKDPKDLGYVQEVIGTAVKDIISVESGKNLFKKGDNIHLVYPMKKDGTKTLMRALLVDPVTAQFSYSWIVVFDMQSGTPVRPVTNFRLASTS